jgi:hypothetical protein
MAARRSPLPDLKTLDAEVLRTLLEAAHAELDSAQEQLLSRDHEIEYLKFRKRRRWAALTEGSG